MKPDVFREQILKQLNRTRLHFGLWGGEWRLPLEACLVRKEARKETKRKKYGVTYGAGSAAWSQSGTN